MAGRAFISRFSPNRTDPKVLEAIFVQRHKLAEVWLERIRDSVLTGVKHHMLAVGPRGCGKSHLVALLLGRLRRDPAVVERVRIAWLPEDETTPSFWKFLLRILRALNAEYGNEFPPPLREELAGATDARRSSVLTDYLLKKLNGRTLLVVVENLDDVMRGLKDEGQKRWRAFLQEHPVAATLATAQQLTEDLSDRDRPFFNFFQIEYLQPLTSDEALVLLRKIAEHTGNTDLTVFLETPTGRARVRAIRHIAGGSHRVFIILSEFATRENLDDLVIAFEQLLDELTPYYQERLRWLPDQQREIVEFLCRQARTVQVKEIAGALYLSEQSAAAQLKSLKDKGYVTAEAVGRESRYELAEPLMRLCVEVKDPQREPIRLIVDFLRAWYDRAGVESRLQCLPADAGLERRYLLAALDACEPDVPDPVKAALNQDLEAARASGDPEELVRVLVDLAATADTARRCMAIAHQLVDLGHHAETLAACDRVIELDPNYATGWNVKGYVLNDHLQRHEEALAVFDRAIELEPKFSAAWHNKGYALCGLERYTEALAAFDRAIELEPTMAHAWRHKGNALARVARHVEALTAFERAIELDPNDAETWHMRGHMLHDLARHAEALVAFDRAIELKPESADFWCCRGMVRLDLGSMDDAVTDISRAIKLNPLRVGSVAFAILARTHVDQGNWPEAERALTEYFRLPPSPAPQYFANLIAAVFRASDDRGVWADRVRRLAEMALAAREEQLIKAQGPAKAVMSRPLNVSAAAPPNPLAILGDSLVRSLVHQGYAKASLGALDAWADVWRKVAERYPDLSLATRLFSVGVKYVQTKDERVLLDLVQEERSILRDLFGLDEDTDN